MDFNSRYYLTAFKIHTSSLSPIVCTRCDTQLTFTPQIRAYHAHEFAFLFPPTIPLTQGAMTESVPRVVGLRQIIWESASDIQLYLLPSVEFRSQSCLASRVHSPIHSRYPDPSARDCNLNSRLRSRDRVGFGFTPQFG